MNDKSESINLNTSKTIQYFSFKHNGESLPKDKAPVCAMSLKKAGSMRFRWAEQNPNRDSFLLHAAGTKLVTPVELNHTKIVYDVKEQSNTLNKIGDGIITRNKMLMPVVTVADCMPIFLYEPKTQVFGIVHSGWKGTGIAAEAIKVANKNYGSEPENFCIILGPHIHECCYIVNEERAEYFAQNFTPDCVTELEDGGKCLCGGRGLSIDWNNGGGKLYRLSLQKANIAMLLKCGIKEENIVQSSDCTCCDTIYGSNRRETSEGKTFTVQAAFIKWPE